jgi:hypothetical protein
VQPRGILGATLGFPAVPDPVLPALALALGVLAALLLAGRLLPVLAAGGAAAVVVAVLLAFHAVPEYDNARVGWKGQRGPSLALDEVDRRADCLARSGHPDPSPFVAWLRAHIPPSARYTAQMPSADGPCLATSLLPRVAVKASQAQYVIFVDQVSADWQTRFAAGQGVVRFGPKRGFAKVAK